MIKICKICGKEYKTYNKNSKYCCTKCQHKGLEKDITGQKFGRLTAIKRLEKYNYLCKCDCGKEKIVNRGNLISGNIKSCGCLQKEKQEENFKKRETHKLSKTKLYKVWTAMKQRCYNKNDEAYKNYGKRNIKVCDEWKNNFESFYNWSIENGYKKGLSIDRIDVNGNYEPDNCRYITHKEQQNNRTNNHYLCYNGEKLSVSDWAKKLKVPRYKIDNKIKRGKNMEQIFLEIAKEEIGEEALIKLIKNGV